jgi:hypothetical protein
MHALQSFISRVRLLLGSITTFLKNLPGVMPRDDTFSPQRVCPFCGLITPRRERKCLECGKSLKFA